MSFADCDLIGEIIALLKRINRFKVITKWLSHLVYFKTKRYFPSYLYCFCHKFKSILFQILNYSPMTIGHFIKKEMSEDVYLFNDSFSWS
jgi:hypothetical protein